MANSHIICSNLTGVTNYNSMSMDYRWILAA